MTTMEGPTTSVDCSGEPPLLDDKEEIAQTKELWETVRKTTNARCNDGSVCVSDKDSITSEDLAVYQKQANESDIKPIFLGELKKANEDFQRDFPQNTGKE